jgi:Ca2+-binding RTX toxin-like protein
VGTISEKAVIDVESLHTTYIVASADQLNAFSTIVGDKTTELRMTLVGTKVLEPLTVQGPVTLQGLDENNRVDLSHTHTNAGWQIDLGSGDDHCVGTQRDDTITGGKGNDDLDGGGGQDTFVLGDHDGREIIHNFEAGLTGDVLNFAHSSRIRNISDFLHHLTDDGHLVYGGSDIDLGATKAFIEDHWVVGNLSFYD